MNKAQIGLIGLATMGMNLARNIADKKTRISVFNRTTKKTKKFIKEYGNEYLSGELTLKSFVKKLETPRKIIILVKAGEAIDMIIEKLTTLLDKGDIIIDGGNSYYKDTERREKELSKKGIYYIGMGISGGEKGALHGPSLMPGGAKPAYLKTEKILKKIAANDGIGGKCVSYLGPEASGHFVKMVHNGIEYGIMQLIAETYDLLKSLGKFSNKELAKTFDEWNKTKNLKSFLIEITAEIFKNKDNLIDLIKDTAKQKGTGKWTTFASMDYGIATPTINAAVEARIISGSAGSRQNGKYFPENLNKEVEIPKKEILKEMAKNALILSTVIAYFQGFNLMQIASEEKSWKLDQSEIARIWRGGCIIRSDFLDKLQKTYGSDKKTSKTAKEEIMKIYKGKAQKDWRSITALGIAYGIPVPGLSSALSHYDALRQERLPQNLTQAQRDFFGAHTYERIDKKGKFHTEWNL